MIEPEQITPQWIATYIDEGVARDAAISWERIGEGGGLLGRIYRVRYSGPEDGSFVLKLPPPTGSVWDHLLAEITPFPREAQSYGLFGPEGAGVTEGIPRCYWATFSSDGSGALALEDLTRDGGFLAGVASGMELRQVEATLDTLARLHAVHAVSRSEGRFDRPPAAWMYTAQSPPLVRILTEALEDAREKSLGELLEAGGEPLRGLLSSLRVRENLTMAHRDSRILSVCHGDVWSNNVMLIPRDGQPERAVVLDWQFTTWGNPLVDVSFLLLSSLDPELREAAAPALVARYYSALRQALPPDVPYGEDDCRADFRQALWYGVLMSVCNLEAFLASVTPGDVPVIVKRLAALARVLPRVRSAS